MKITKAIIAVMLLCSVLSSVAFAVDTPLHQIRKHPVDPRAAINPGEGAQQNGAVDGCEFSKDGVYYIASDNYGETRIYVTQTGELIGKMTHQYDASNNCANSGNEINGLAFSADGLYIATGDGGNEGVKVWDATVFTEGSYTEIGTNDYLYFYRDGAEVDGLDFSLNNKWLAVASDEDIYIYDQQNSFSQVLKIDGESEAGAVNSVDFSHDSKYMIWTGGGSSYTYLYSTPDLDGSWTYRDKFRTNNYASVKSCRFSPDDQYICVSGRNQQMEVWKVNGGNRNDFVQEHVFTNNENENPFDCDDQDSNAAVEAVEWTPDGQYLISGGLISGRLSLWNVGTWDKVTFSTGLDYIMGQQTNRQIEFIDCFEDFVMVGGDEGGIRIFGLDGADFAQILTHVTTMAVDPYGTNGAVDGCEFSKDGTYFTATDNHGVARIYKTADCFVGGIIGGTGVPDWTVLPYKKVTHYYGNVSGSCGGSPGGADKNYEINAVTWSHDGLFMSTGRNDDGTKIWKTADIFNPDNVPTYEPANVSSNNTPYKHLLDGTTETDGSDFSPNGLWFATAYDDSMRVFTLPNFTQIQNISGGGGAVNTIDFLYDSSLVVFGASNDYARVYETTTWTQVWSHDFGNDHSIKSTRFSPDGQYLAISGKSTQCSVWRTSDWTKVCEIVQEGSDSSLPCDDSDTNPACESVEWHVDSTYLLTSGKKTGKMYVWDTSTWPGSGSVTLVEADAAQVVQSEEVDRQIEFIDVYENLVIVGGDSGYLRMWAFETALPPEAATVDSPADGEPDVTVTTDISWNAGARATSHDVYFGTDSTPDAGEFIDNRTPTTYDPGTLLLGTTYYWAIDEVNSAGTTPGPVWSFTTNYPANLTEFGILSTDWGTLYGLPELVSLSEAWLTGEWDPPVIETDVTILSTWTSGTTHAAPAASNRALVLTVHGEGPDGIDQSASATYGGQPMTRIIDQNNTNGIRPYAALFILDDAGITAAANSDFLITWAPTTTAELHFESIFLENVNQATPVGDSDGGYTNSGGTVSTSALATNDGDFVILAATHQKTSGIHTILSSGFTTAYSLANSDISVVAGHKLATGSAETPSVSYPVTNKRQVIVGAVIKSITS